MLIDGTYPRHRFAPPALGADTAAVLAELGLSPEQVDELAAAGIVQTHVQKRPDGGSGMTDQHVDYSVLDRTAYIRIDRPERRNAMAVQTTEELRDAFLEAGGDPDVWAIVLTGTGIAPSAPAATSRRWTRRPGPAVTSTCR